MCLDGCHALSRNASRKPALPWVNLLRFSLHIFQSLSMLVDLIAGARPNFVKIAALVRALDAHRAAGGALRYRIVHTGQHYDPRLSGDFFRQLGIPEPTVNLEVGSGTHGAQTAAILTKYEALLMQLAPAVTVVVGDVTSTMACAIAAQKLHVPVAHVEAGIRSGDWTMPEEINRLVTDAITNWFFTTSEFANETLRRSGVEDNRIHFVGNTMIDTLLRELPRSTPPKFWKELGLTENGYIVLTLHRPSNVDDPKNLRSILDAVHEGAGGVPVVFPVHPRTASRLTEMSNSLGYRLPPTIFAVEPQPYLEFTFLVRNAMGVATDSGGITEEATVLKVPCMTLRSTTERPETVSLGTNELLGADPSALVPALTRLRRKEWKQGTVPPLWDGRAGERIVGILVRVLVNP